MKTILIAVLLCVSLYGNSQSFELIDRGIFEYGIEDTSELQFSVTDFFIADWECGNLKDDTIVITSLETFQGYTVWQLEDPGLKGVDRVILVEFEWIGCCSYMESHYFLSTDTCGFVKLDVLENVSCDFPEERVEYVFPNQEFGEPAVIKEALISYSDKGEIQAATQVELKSPVGHYNYDSSFVVTGILKLESYYGPPGYGEDPNFDDKFQSWVLYLNQPINVYEFDPEESINMTAEMVDVVQLHIRGLDFKPYEGHAVQLKGVFYSPHTGYHQERILMTVEEVSASR